MYDASPSRRPTSIVVGAGLAGLAAATRLASLGEHRVTLVEATPEGGGRCRSFDAARFDRPLDNGQHLMMACYVETLGFLRQIGVPRSRIEFQRNMHADMRTVGGRQISIDCPALPAPLHLAAGLVRARGLGVVHKLSAIRAGLSLSSEVVRPDDRESCAQWLRRMGQTQRMRRFFWEPLVWGVLNDDPEIASAAMFLAVIERAFLRTRDASCFGIPRVPLSELYLRPALKFLAGHEAEVRMSAPARRLIVRDDRATGIELRSGEQLFADHVVLAIPPHALLRILPEPVAADPVFRDVAQLKYSPIVNLWATVRKRFVAPGSFVGLVDSPLHWIFDRSCTDLKGPENAEERLISVTISGARRWIGADEATLRRLLEAELSRYFPERTIPLREFRVIREKRATISHAVGSYNLRPQVESPLPGLFLAGDWVRTGLPATIESAVLSGHQAADAILGRGP